VEGPLFFWVSDALSNNMWGQVGYYLFNGVTPVAFYSVWNLTSYTAVASGAATVPVGSHQFSMSLQAGTTWAFALDGSAFGTYNMAANVSSSSYPVYAVSEEYASAPFPFSTVKFVVAMEVLRSGTWTPVKFASSYGTGWGVQGALQNSNLTNDQIVISSSLPALAGGTALWNGLPPVTGPPDTVAPTVGITSPSTGATVSRTVSVSVNANDNVGVTKVELYKDGTLFDTLTNSPYTFSWDTTQDQDGAHSLVANAYDAANNVGTSNTIAVSVDNTPPPSPDLTPPTVSIASPTNGATVSGAVSVSVSASDNIGVTKVELYKDGTPFASLTNSPYAFTWDTAGDQDGSHTLVAKAYDAANNFGTSNTIAVSVDNTPPKVTITSPVSGATVKGSVTISVSASDTSGVQRIEFYIDGKLKATDYTAPYTYQWNSKSVKAGTHTILVIAYDRTGSMRQTSVTVIVK